MIGIFWIPAESCDCKTLYIYAEGAIESKQSATLGRYALQVDAKDETPVYKRVKENWQKDGDVKNHFLIFRNGGKKNSFKLNGFLTKHQYVNNHGLT